MLIETLIIAAVVSLGIIVAGRRSLPHAQSHAGRPTT
jgi:hypothetical protein